VPDWGVWIIVTAFFMIGELVTPGLFFLGAVVPAAVAAALIAALGGGIGWQLGAFVVGSAASLGLLRPIAVRHVHLPPATRTGTAALVGAKALALERVDSRGGLVKIGGETWSARAYIDDQVIEPGTRVEVAQIEGATALVYE